MDVVSITVLLNLKIKEMLKMLLKKLMEK